MLATEEAVESLARAVGREGLVKWVIDPVMVSALIYIYYILLYMRGVCIYPVIYHIKYLVIMDNVYIC
jgi:hypothetical protein